MFVTPLGWVNLMYDMRYLVKGRAVLMGTITKYS